MKYLKYLLIVFMLLVVTAPALADEPDFDFDGFDADIPPPTEEDEATVSSTNSEPEIISFDIFDAGVEEVNIQVDSVDTRQNQCVTMVGPGNSRGSYEVCFKGVDYNNDNTSTWTYSITNNGAQGLSHWTLNLCEEPISPVDAYITIGSYGDTSGRVDVYYPVSWGQDKTTFGQGVPIFKYDSGMDDGETDIFQFTLNGRYDTLSTLDIATKSGRKTGTAFGKITGPDCNKIATETPEPTKTPEPTPTSTPTPVVTPEPPSNAKETSCYNVSAAVSDNYYGKGHDHAFWLPKISEDLVFNPDGKFVEYDDETARLTGTLIHKNNTTRGFKADLSFSGRTTVNSYIKKELKKTAYKEKGGPINTDSWHYYSHFGGTLTGLAGGPYEGAIINVIQKPNTPFYGVGYGASNKNIGFGASGWLQWTVQQQPTNGKPLPTNKKGDININLSPCAVPLSALGDYVWRDLNENGLQDNDEPGIEGVSVILYEDDGDGVFEPNEDRLAGTTNTDQNGKYMFEGLMAGNYFVQLNNGNGKLNGFETSPLNRGDDKANDSDGIADNPKKPTSVVTKLINLPVNTTDKTWDFGLFEPRATAVTLMYFSPAVEGNQVVLRWETASEVDNIGFNIYRGLTAKGPFVKINNGLIAAADRATSGATYSFVDTPGTGEFFYYIEDVDFYGVGTAYAPTSVQIVVTE